MRRATIRDTFTRHPGGERVVLDPDEDAAHILDAAGTVQQTIEGVGSASEPWAVACFSTDGKALVLADPARRARVPLPADRGDRAPRWAAVASADDQNQLLRAIIDNPDDDTARLVYADWLDEHDDPTRAEFVRLQCRLAERMQREAVPGTDPDQQREFQLRAQMGERWLAELPAVRGVRWNGFWRGFADRVGRQHDDARARRGESVVRGPGRVGHDHRVEHERARMLTGSDVLDRIRVLALDRYSTRRDGEKPLRDLLHSPRVARCAG